MERYILYVFALCYMFLTSCHTSLQVAEIKLDTYDRFDKEIPMEFIGFKNLNRNNTFIKSYGATLERQQIAINKQGYYMGVYTMEELATYKSTKRFMAFIDVINHSYSYSDAVSDNEGLELGGWLIAGFTCFTLFPVYVPMLCAADKNDCLITLRGEYILYLYDTEEKEIVLTIPMQISEQEKYKGQYAHKNTDKLAVTQRYQNMLYNLWTDSFAKAYDFIEHLHE